MQVCLIGVLAWPLLIYRCLSLPSARVGGPYRRLRRSILTVAPSCDPEGWISADEGSPLAGPSSAARFARGFIAAGTQLSAPAMTTHS